MPQKIDSDEPRSRRIAQDALSSPMVSGGREFVENVAAEALLIAICELMGVPTYKRCVFLLPVI
jgi:cytochrome P450